ncbi:uncharacterized protein LOC132296410 [Cornus florida]|uniref:uncharacterized protein LOC132296410 n=1 Tax=Cornus florida TaxID=4283 RepID=UPI00289EF0B3|nr:uncharacterized protein LOC132296410 [Cornus florida]
MGIHPNVVLGWLRDNMGNRDMSNHYRLHSSRMCRLRLIQLFQHHWGNQYNRCIREGCIMLHHMMHGHLTLIKETKIWQENVAVVRRNIAHIWSIVCNYQYSTLGRVWILWNPMLVSVYPTFTNGQVINCSIWIHSLNTKCLASFVYRANTVVKRVALWKALHIHNEPGGPWILMGDFNVLLHVNESFGGANRWTKGMLDFKECLHKNELEDLRFTGIQFTCTNNSFRCANISRKLDRVLVLNEKFIDIVFHGWQNEVFGTEMFNVVQKLRALKYPLKLLNKRAFGSMVDIYRKELSQCQANLDLNLANDHLRLQEKDLAVKFSELCLAEEIFYKQKVQIHWLKVGDQNISFFMKSFSSKANRRKVVSIEDSLGNTIQGLDLRNEFLNYFQNLLGQSYSTYPDLSINCSKSQVFFSGVDRQTRIQIQSLLQFDTGMLPITYLGLPLSSSAINATDCQSLIHKITTGFSSWTSRFLLYAGRAVLIKSILHSIQAYWSQAFIIPIKEGACGWTGSIGILSKTKVSGQSKLTQPILAFGGSSSNLETWREG